MAADLSLPDAEGLDLLRRVLQMAPHAAVLVLTGRTDAAVGIAAVAAGAEDYLIKHEVDGPLLARAIRYALERKRAEESERQLMEAELRSEENARIELGLLPVPLIDDTALHHHTRYRPGRERALLGGDFYDTVQTRDGSVHLMIRRPDRGPRRRRPRPPRHRRAGRAGHRRPRPGAERRPAHRPPRRRGRVAQR